MISRILDQGALVRAAFETFSRSPSLSPRPTRIDPVPFPRARFHDSWAIYQGDVWKGRPAEGFALSPSIRLIETPGHTPQDITTLVSTSGGTVAFTHLWWRATGPAEDPLASDPSALHRNRARVLEIAQLIVPGHGAAFKPSAETPR